MLGNLALAFTIGAAVSNKHAPAVGKVQADFSSLGSAVKKLSADAKNLDRFAAARQAFMKAASGAHEARAKLAALKAEFEKAPSDRLEKQVRRAADAFEAAKIKAFDKRKALTALKDTLKSAEINTSKLASEQVRLGRAYEEAKKKQMAMGSALAARQNLGQTWSAAQGQIAVGAAALYGTGSAIAKPVMQGATFEDQIRQIAITGEFAGSNQEAQLGATVRRNAQLFKQTTSEINKGLQVLVAEGVDAAKAGDMSAILAKGATATRASFEDLAKMTANFDKVLGVKDMELAYSQVAKAGKLGSFEIKDMAKWFPSLGGLMKSLGVSGNEAVVSLAARMQIAKRTAGTSDEAANNFKNFLSKLSATDTAKDFDKLGINLNQRMMGAAAKGLDPIAAGVDTVLEVMAKKSPESVAAMQKMAAEIAAIKDPAERAAEMERRSEFIKNIGDKAGLGKMFQDMQAMSYLLAELQNKNDLADIIGKTTTGKAASGQLTIDQDFADQVSLTTAKIDQMKIAWEEVGIIIGKTIKPVSDGVISSVTWLGDAISSVARSSPAAAVGITTVLGSAIVGKAAYGAAQISKAVIGMGRAISGLAGAEAAAGIGTLGKLSGAMSRVAGWATRLSGIGKALGTIGILAAVGVGVANAADATKSTEDRVKSGTGAAGAIAGGLAGAKLGATIGTLIAPGVGTAIGGVLGSIIGAVAGEKVLGEIGAAFVRWWPGVQSWFSGLPAKFEQFGLAVTQGIANGLRSGMTELKSTVVGMGDNVTAWFKDKLGIRSPSRVFMSLGEMVGEGAAIGIGHMSSGVGKAAAALGMAATAGFSPALAAPNMPSAPAAVQAMPFTAPAAAAAVAPRPAVNVTIGPFHITQMAGENAEGMARRVAELVRKESEAVRRGALGDWA